MEYSNNQDKSEFERHKSKIQENIDMGKNMGINKISAILAIQDESEEIQTQLIKWLLIDGYRISLKKEESKIFMNIIMKAVNNYRKGSDIYE